MDQVQLRLLKQRIIAQADNPNGNVRRMVAMAIRELNIRDEIVSILNKYLVDKQWQVRFEAVRTLKYTSAGDKDSAISFLARRLGIEYGDLRGGILAILSGNVTTEKEGDVAKKEIVGEVKKEIAISIAWLDHAILIDPLMAGLASENPNIQIAGAVGLGNVGHPKAVPELEKAATNSALDSKVRKAAIVSLGKIKEKNSFNSLKQLIDDKSEDIRKEAVIAINHLKHENAHEVFLRTIKDSSPSVREVSCIALGNVKKREYIEYLFDALKDLQPNVRKAAAEAIGSWREIESIPYLLDRMDDGNEYVQNEIALAYLRFPRILDRLNIEDFLLGKTTIDQEEVVDEAN